jgi:hypothetical protein
MTDCTHDLAERETACADGMCPLCIAKDAAYYRSRLQEIIPLFEEARDALPAITLVSAKLHNIDLSLGNRMDIAGTKTRADFDRLTEKEINDRLKQRFADGNLFQGVDPDDDFAADRALYRAGYDDGLATSKEKS